MDWKDYVAIALLWWGLGVATVAIAWAIERHRAKKRFDRIVHKVTQQMGHVVTPCDHGDKIHMQCLCGGASLLYKKDDPTADVLLAQWEEEHVLSQNLVSQDKA